MNDATDPNARPSAPLAFWAGVAAAVALIALPPPEGLSEPAMAAAGIGLMMAIWWLTEALPLPATALAPLALFPLLGVAPLEAVATAYADPLILLFLGGFLIARAIEAWDLHRRLAVAALARTGRRPSSVVAAIMAAAAFLSLWISNTAATMVMAPIAAAVAAARPQDADEDADEDEDEDEDYAAALMLGVAFAATIGGMGSLIGTPPNALFAAYMREAHGIEIGFADWMLVGLPIALILLPIAWAVLTRFAFRLKDAAALTPAALGPIAPMSAGARRVAIVACCAAAGWIARPGIAALAPELQLSDAGIAMLAALALFALPSGAPERPRLLDWETAAGLRWDVLLLFGGGLALAQAIDRTGLALWIGDRAQALEGWPVWALIAAIALVIVYLGELASNTAMAAVFLPVAGATALGLGADPLAFALPVALAASIGFMLPVATPPNAIAFAHPAVTRARMLRAGAPLDLIGVIVALLIGGVLGPLVFGATS